MTQMAIAIINYNTCDYLRGCLESIAATQAAEVVVVDNASMDGSQEMVRRDFPWVTLLTNNENPGYGAAANQALAHCRSPYVLLLNSDTRLLPGTLQELSDYLDRHRQAAIVGPRLLNGDRSLQPSCFPFPTPFITFLRVTIWGGLIRYLPLVRDHYLFTWAHDYNRVVPWVLGAALAIRRPSFAEVGGFDPSFFMFSEEVDLCYRLRKVGYEVHFAADAAVIHYGGASTSQRHREMEVQRYAATRHFYRRHYPTWWLPLLRVLVTYSMLRSLIRDNVRRFFSRRVTQRVRLSGDLILWKRILANAWEGEP